MDNPHIKKLIDEFIEFVDVASKQSIDREKRICENFEDYGYYNCVEEVENKIAETDIIVGDAIDALVYIYKELSEVQWRWENTSVADALWYYDHMYRAHWGSHLRNLQLYVFYKQYGA